MILAISFGVTLGLGIKEVTGVSVVMSLLAMIYQSTKPHFAVLGKMLDSNEYRNVNRFDNLKIQDYILVCH